MDNEDIELTPKKGIEEYLSLNLKLLSWLGFIIRPSDNRKIEQTSLLKKMPIFWGIMLGFYGGASQMMFIAEGIKSNDYFFAAQVTAQMLSNFLCMVKGIRLITCITKLNGILQELAMVWQRYMNSHVNRDVIRNKARNTLIFCKVFMMVTFSVVLSYALPPIRNFVLIYIHRNVENYTGPYDERIFYIKYPFSIHNYVIYLVVIFEEICGLMSVALIWICGDTLFAQLTTHASLQFEMLRHDVEVLMNDDISEVILKRNFVKLIVRHKILLRICERIEKFYSPLILVTVLVSGVSMCFNMYEVSETINNGRFADASAPGFILMNVFLQIVFYCVFAEALTKQVSTIGDAIYNSKWTDKHYKFRAYVQMIIIKSQKPFYCTAYGFFPIGHPQLTVVLKTAFSYYMMLTATT